MSLPAHLGNDITVSNLAVDSTKMRATASAWAGKPLASQRDAYDLYFNGTKWSVTKR